MRKAVLSIGAPVAVAALLATGMVGCAAPPSLSRHAATGILDASRAIVTPDGVQTLEKVWLGGIPQWISVRGRHRQNPILLVLHGGPGFTMMPAGYLHQTAWEEYFTVVQWDQRGAGKTFRENDTARVAPTGKIERMVHDAEELVELLRARYQRQKIFVLGHSWGTVIGIELAKSHPEWLFAYVGIGQMIHTRRSEALAYRAALAEATRTGNQQARRELERLAPYPDPDGAAFLAKLEAQRKWLTAFGGYTYRKLNDHYFDVVSLSPDYTDRDVKAWADGSPSA